MGAEEGGRGKGKEGEKEGGVRGGREKGRERRREGGGRERTRGREGKTDDFSLCIRSVGFLNLLFCG